MTYTNAFNCKRCPQRNDEKGCPAWWEWVEESTTGEQRLSKRCGWQAMPEFLVQVIRASNRPAAAIESTRNEIVQGLGRMAGLMAHMPLQLNQDK